MSAEDCVFTPEEVQWGTSEAAEVLAGVKPGVILWHHRCPRHHLEMEHLAENFYLCPNVACEVWRSEGTYHVNEPSRAAYVLGTLLSAYRRTRG